MRLLLITGDDDYHFLTYENQDDFTLEDIVAECEKEKKMVRFDVNDGEEYFDAEIYEFGDVCPDFIKFVRNNQDYDETKHRDWVIIED